MPAYGSQKGTREIFLTFDDGPHPKTTPIILDVLAKHCVKALFFVVGQCVSTKEGRAIMERAHKEGHHIGNHTFTHPDLKTLSPDKVREELKRTQDIIGSCGHGCRFFRPPYGSTNSAVSQVLQEEGYMPIMWTVDTMDWKLKKDGAWVENGMNQVKAREDSLVLMHDIHLSTAQHLDRFISSIKRIQNSQFVQYA